ncbi:ribose transport system ATP-binding protein [Motilibacter peucedani]|uniref:Ribose transport system ATP-binding protein n=1 Tax=Motilibacter peucedani TaxID=598650 RepID=A0A420XTA5_9ACTN|nr:sugar ABC transporter ATP-binding protein [Motilibacter peucedani]RKS80044.1 ribose transport system ATP-binding protein [Motilibacter peucedani]
MPTVRLKTRGLTKQFGSAVVLKGVDFDVREGEIHGLIGQNGAGKSTLVKTLAGLYPDHGGTVEVDGQRVGLRTPRQSRAEGIAVIYQEFSLVPSMTVAENLLLGREKHAVRYSSPATRQEAARLLESVQIDIGASLDTPVAELSPAVMQRIEIAKALAQDASVLVMDEPTARLSEEERGWLFSTMRRLSDSGVGIMFISHFLEEVRGVTDHLTVLRNGAVVGEGSTSAFSVARMAELMLGEGLKSALESESHISRAGPANPVVLSAQHVVGGERLGPVSLELRAREIVGVAGLVGSGRTRLARVLTGADRPTGGHIAVEGQTVTFRSPRQAIASGVVLVPEDRKHQGLSLVAPVADNLSLMSLQQRRGRAGFVGRRYVRSLAQSLVTDLQVAPPRIDLPASALSGGNQQKVLLGKAIAARPQVLVIDQPTAGVDVGTKAQIHGLLHAMADDGVALMVVSDDIDELYALSDRLCVMRKGRIVWQGTPGQVGREELLAMMSAATDDATDEEACG